LTIAKTAVVKEGGERDSRQKNKNWGKKTSGKMGDKLQSKSARCNVHRSGNITNDDPVLKPTMWKKRSYKKKMKTVRQVTSAWGGEKRKDFR